MSRYLAIMLCALALAVGLTQALAVTPDPQLGNITAVLQGLASVSALILALRLRHHPGFGMAVGGTVLLTLAALLWLTATMPTATAETVNRFNAWAGLSTVLDLAKIGTGSIDLASLSIWLVGMSFLVLSAIRQPVVRGPRGPLPLMRETLSRM